MLTPATPSALQVGLLGPVIAERQGRLLPLGGPKQRAVLAALALQPGRAVPTQALVEAVWGDQAAMSAAKTLQVYVANLRKLLEPDRVPGDAPTVLRTSEPGYVLDIESSQVDTARFERGLHRGRELARDDDHHGAAHALRDALAEWRGTVLADLVALPIQSKAAGRLDELRLDALELCCASELAIGIYEALVPELEALVALAPYRERLRCLLIRALYAAGRQRDALRAFQDARRILVEELGIEPGQELRALERQVLEQDPALKVSAVERVQEVVGDAPPLVRKQVSVVAAVLGDADADLSRQLVAIVSEHGATLMETGADRTVAVFGAPRLGDDDVDRAAHLALALRELGGRGGVATGVAAASGAVVSGAPLSRAVELACAARSAQVCLDAMTRDLLGARATTAPFDTGVFELVAVSPIAPEVTLGGAFVGRDEELQLLASAWDVVVRTRRLGVVTLVGETGVGTSRLAEEVCAIRGGPALHVRVDAATDADGLVAELRQLEERDEPATAIVDGVHRGSRAALAALSRWLFAARDEPVLVIVSASPELARRLPTWPGPVPLALTIDVPPLHLDDARRLAALLLGDDVVGARALDVARASAGNPLFITELARSGDAETGAAPSRLSSLFAARVDALPPLARTALEAIAVLGGSTDVAALDELVDDLGDALDALVGSGLVAVDDEALAVNEVVVQVALHGLSHDRGAALHRRAASSARGARAAAHLEAAVRHGIALGDPQPAEVLSGAVDALCELAWRAWSTADVESAVDALARAVQLDADAGAGAGLVGAVRRARRRLAANALGATAMRSPAMGAGTGTLLAVWDADRPEELDLLRAVEALRDDATSPDVRSTCDAVLAALTRSDQGSSASSSA